VAELLKRLGQHGNLTFQLVLASVFINVLGLASAMYVMQVLRRYISYGVDATLMTLTIGTLIAILFTFIFKNLRVRLARGVNHPAQDLLEEKAYATLTRARSGALMMFDTGTQQEIMSGLKFIQNAYSPNQVISVLDLPFAFLYLFAVMILNPVVSLVVLCFMIFMLGYNYLQQHKIKNSNQELSSIASKFSSMITNTIRSADSVRIFNAKNMLLDKWKKDLDTNKTLQENLMLEQARSSAFSQSVSSLLTVSVICVGAIEVVAYDMSIGSLIGANILASRAFGPITGFINTNIALNRASYYLGLLKKFFEIPMEPEDGTKPSQYHGSMLLKNISFNYQTASDMLFSNLTAAIKPGQFTVIVGDNGSGKTTLARILTSLLRPNRGQILVDGVDLEQHQLSWWRQQIIYLPQEPTFFDGTLRDNLKTLNPVIHDDELKQLIAKVDLAKFLDQSKQGLDMAVTDSGNNFALGIRRRLAFVRALVGNGAVAILDEPSEGLDIEGQNAVFSIIKEFRMSGKTVFLFSSRPPQQFPNADMLIDLNSHPVPSVKSKVAVPSEDAKPS